MSLTTLSASSDAQRHQSNVDQPNLPRVTITCRSFDLHLAEQLGSLASQHHASEYNCLKYGPNGAPAQYIPLSLQAPDFYKQLQDQQARASITQAWWVCQKPTNATALACSIPHSSAADSPERDAPFSCSVLQEELLRAISSPLSPQISPLPQNVPAAAVKTSGTHPINISFLIPTELIPIISSHLSYLDQYSPVLFDLPLSHQLYRLISIPFVRQSPTATTQSKPKLLPVSGLSLSSWRHVTIVPNIAKHAHPHPYVSSHPHSQPDAGHRHDSASPIPRTPGLVNFLWNQRIARAGKAVISTGYGIKLPGLPSIPISLPSAAPPDAYPSNPSANIAAQARSHWPQSNVSTKSACAAPFASATKVQKHYPSPICALDVRVEATIVSGDKLSGTSTTKGCHRNSIDRDIENAQLLGPSQTIVDASVLSELNVTVQRSRSAPVKITDSGKLRSEPRLPHTTTLGNLFMSSCPGKKVRLTGPVNGRGTVCRDLLQDLQRMKDIGVGCVVCCLDDEELRFLGAPWEEYSHAAEKIGLDVLRLPTPEGLAPADPPTLDEHLSRLIETYTLAGIPILVHCRGGVGRAGIVACCWALKLGLCGWIETQPTAAAVGASNFGTHAKASRSSVRRDTLQLVERVITLVRRRRSPKAVETYEQVKFLVDYVDFLRTKASMRGRDKEGAVEASGSSSREVAPPLLQPHEVDTLTNGVDIGQLQFGSVMESDIRVHAQDLFLDT